MHSRRAASCKLNGTCLLCRSAGTSIARCLLSIHADQKMHATHCNKMPTAPFSVAGQFGRQLQGPDGHLAAVVPVPGHPALSVGPAPLHEAPPCGAHPVPKKGFRNQSCFGDRSSMLDNGVPPVFVAALLHEATPRGAHVGPQSTLCCSP